MMKAGMHRLRNGEACGTGFQATSRIAPANGWRHMCAKVEINITHGERAL